MTGGVEGIKKPKVVHEYNQHMGGVDQSDQLLMYYGYSHRQVKSSLGSFDRKCQCTIQYSQHQTTYATGV